MIRTVRRSTASKKSCLKVRSCTGRKRTTPKRSKSSGVARRMTGWSEIFINEFPMAASTCCWSLCLLLFGVPGITVFAIQMMTMPVFAAGIINGLGHYAGYRNFECDDAATNLVPWAFLIGGEELHNNHHAFPTSAKFSVRRWEFDIGWLYLRVFQALGLAKVRKIAPHPIVAERPRQQVDLDNLRTIIINRMHVLRDYTRFVTLPVLKHERAVAAGNRLLRKARKLLVRQPVLLDEKSTERLRDLLSDNAALETVYEFRERLRGLWSGAGISNEKLLAQLKDWCAEAEASGIKALEDFAARLRSYQLA